MTDPRREPSGTQEGRPSDVDALEARQGLALQWWLAPLVLVATAVAIVVVKLV
jgi:hypothetical protein